MKQNISALMDGELCDEDADILLDRIRKDPVSRQEWAHYHLIGDVLRQPDYPCRKINATFFERLQAEPTILSPCRRHNIKASIFAVSAVASGMAVVLLAWLEMGIDTDATYSVQRQQLVSVQAPAQHWNSGVNDYLMAHHEFSPSNDVRGASTYTRVVASKQILAEK